MSKIAGVDVLLKVKNADGTLKIVGGQTGTSLSRQANTIDVSDKNSGAWSSSIVGLKSWSIDADGFVSLGDEGQELLEKAFEDREKIVAEIRLGKNDDAKGVTYEGECVITELSNEFGQDDAVTFSLSLAGAGELKRTVGTKLE